MKRDLPVWNGLLRGAPEAEPITAMAKWGDFSDYGENSARDGLFVWRDFAGSAEETRAASRRIRTVVPSRSADPFEALNFGRVRRGEHQSVPEAIGPESQASPSSASGLVASD